MTCHVPPDVNAEIRAYATERGLTIGEIFSSAWLKFREGDEAFKVLAENYEAVRVEALGLKEALKLCAEKVREVEGKNKRLTRRSAVLEIQEV